MALWCRCRKSRFELSRAPRLLLRCWPAFARGALRCCAVWLMCLAGAPSAFAEYATACADGDGAYILRVCLVDVPGPVRYGHGVLGSVPEWDELSVEWGPTKPDALAHRTETVVLKPSHVYEDIAPRVVDLDRDRKPEIVVVQSSYTRGARLVVYVIDGASGGLVEVATPYIGQRYRWLAPAAIGDLDQDGQVELAYIDRPHLAKVLRVWRYEDRALHPVADAPGLTNHRIGDAFIEGGLRSCAGYPEILTADVGWRNIIASRLVDGKIAREPIGPYSKSAMVRAMTCGG